MGAESGSEANFKKIKKGITLEQIRHAVKLCKKNGFETSLFFMIGFPWEGESEINETLSFMEELNPQFAVYSIATPYPGTELFEIYKQENLLPEDIDWSRFFHQSPEMFLTHKLSREKIKEIIEETEKKFIRHNRKKQRQKLLNPYKLFLELKEYYKSPKELLSRIRYVIKR